MSVTWSTSNEPGNIQETKQTATDNASRGQLQETYCGAGDSKPDKHQPTDKKRQPRRAKLSKETNISLATRCMHPHSITVDGLA